MLLLEEEKKNLISALRLKGINDEKVLKAIHDVPREKFVSEALRRFAYDDNALPIGGNQTISQPFTVAYMTSALDVLPGNKVLEVGTGSGYQTAVLCKLGAEVYTIERMAELSNSARDILGKVNCKAHFKVGDGTLGWKEHAQFDRIIVTAGGPDVPEALLEQLRIGGKLVMPVGSREFQKLYVIIKTENGYDYQSKEHFKFVPLIGENGWQIKEQ